LPPIITVPVLPLTPVLAALALAIVLIRIRGIVCGRVCLIVVIVVIVVVFI
jgi:hypothetical protein